MTSDVPVPVRLGDLVLDVLDLGPRDGEAVVLLHGFPQSAHCWRLVHPALVAHGYRVLVPDQRGYAPGARPADVGAYALPHLVGDVLGLLDALDVARAHVVGHDWGAAVAWQLASRHADRVRTLTAVSVPHPLELTRALREDADQRERSAYMLGFQQPDAEQALMVDDAAGLRRFFTGTTGAVDVEACVARMREPGALTAALSWCRAASSADLEGLEPVTVPTTYVWSDDDLALGRRAAEATQRQVAAPYRFVVLEGVSHFVPEDAADALAVLVLEQLRA